MINHRGGILIFCQNLNFGKNRKFEILNPSSNPNFGSLTLQIFNFGKFWISTQFNFAKFGQISSSAFQKHQNRQIWTNFGRPNPKFLISQILWVLGKFQNPEIFDKLEHLEGLYAFSCVAKLYSLSPGYRFTQNVDFPLFIEADHGLRVARALQKTESSDVISHIVDTDVKRFLPAKITENNNSKKLPENWPNFHEENCGPGEDWPACPNLGETLNQVLSLPSETLVVNYFQSTLQTADPKTCQK